MSRSDCALRSLYRANSASASRVWHSADAATLCQKRSQRSLAVPTLLPIVITAAVATIAPSTTPKPNLTKYALRMTRLRARRTVPPAGPVERREHRNTSPAYSPKVLYFAGRPTVWSRACVRRRMRAAPSVQSQSDRQRYVDRRKNSTMTVIAKGNTQNIVPIRSNSGNSYCSD